MKVIYVYLAFSHIVCSLTGNRYCITLPFQIEHLWFSSLSKTYVSFQEFLACEGNTCNSSGFQTNSPWIVSSRELGRKVEPILSYVSSSLTPITFSREPLILERNEWLHNFEKELLVPLLKGEEIVFWLYCNKV